MSLRPRSGQKAATAAAPVGATPGLHNLSRVLSIGIANNVTSMTKPLSENDLELTPVEFVLEAERIAEIDAKFMGMSAEDRDAFMKSVKEEAKKQALLAKEMAMKRGKEAFDLTKKGAMAMVNRVKLAWANAKDPAHFLTASAKDLKKRFSTDFRRTFTENGWKNLKAGKDDPERQLNIETGANMRVVIEFEGPEGKVTVAVYAPKNQAAADKLTRIRKKDLVNELDDPSYKNARDAIENMAFKMIQEVKDELANAMKG